MAGTKLDTTQGSLWGHTWKLAIPVIVAEFLYSSYGFVDLYFIGQLGEPAAHAAVACIFPLMVLNAALFKIGQVGTLSLTAQYTGAQREDRVAEVVGTALWWSVVFSTCVAVVGALAADWIVYPVIPKLPETGLYDAAVAAEAATYLRIIFLGAPLFQISAVIDGAFKGRGDTTTPMIIEALALAVNILTTGALTQGWFGIPPMGVAGAAIASLVARGLAVTLGGTLLAMGRAGFRPKMCWTPDRALLRAMLRIGVPQGGAIIIYFSAMTAVFNQAGYLGAAAVSAIGIGIRQIEFVAFTHYLGFNAAAATIVGQNIGAGDVERAGRGGFIAALGGGIVGFTAMLIFALFPDQLADLLASGTGDPAVIINTKQYVFLVALSQLPLGFDIAIIGVFIGAGRTMLPLMMNIVALSARVVAVVLIVQYGFGIPVERRFEAICWAITGTSILKGCLMALAFKAGWWRPREGRVTGRI